jgi:hypothetical protein
MAKLQTWIWKPKPTLEQKIQRFADSLTDRQKNKFIHN